VRGLSDLVVAQQAAEDALLENVADPYAAVRHCSVDAEDARRTASTAVAEILGSSKPTGAGRATVRKLAENAWLNGCLVGLLLAGSPTSEPLSDCALMTAKQELDQAPEPDQDSPTVWIYDADGMLEILDQLDPAKAIKLRQALGSQFMASDCVRQLLRGLNLEPRAVVTHGTLISASFTEPLAKLPGARKSINRDYILPFKTLWFAALAAGMKARRDHDEPQHRMRYRV
jgi:hypothetical protein